ncbi:DUF2338 family protein [Paenibacillus zeisoli]|uniref:DUF2338 family protein n=1 Tax=Paenibacillus zeisoli TaxID=2496267 RepID=A0A3S1JSL7_9BACL|nr:opine metallophore biosynthesis dehydrogenase [Paenibacillus zeisoli]RUT35799.1 DUF2338 family protein [Paenibacillus zeisoli]
MGEFKRVLVLGTGPVSIQMSILFKNYLKSYVGIAGRESVHSAALFSALNENNQFIQAFVQNEQHRLMEGRCQIDQVFHGYSGITGEWDTLIMGVTTDAYIEIMGKINEKILEKVKCIVLISPTLGSNNMVRHYLKEKKFDIEVVSFSTYLGDTRWMDGTPSNQVMTTGVKKKLYAGSSFSSSANMRILSELYAQLGIGLNVMNSPIEAESRNISLYVHPPLFMNEFSLSVVFRDEDSKKYVYKLYPEGPITMQLIRDMRSYWEEISLVLDKMNVIPVNLLKFMTDDNYPVLPGSLSRHSIDHFTSFPPIHQEYLLYVRYASLLIDPFSQPDQEGRYFDFSAVPIRQIYVNKEGKWDIPRMPKEDYYRVKMIQGMGRMTGTSTPTLDKFIATYESKIASSLLNFKNQQLSEAFRVQSFEEDWLRIGEEIIDK